jgi:hypothetical protein
MFKGAIEGIHGRSVLVLGLSFANLDKLRADAPNGGFIKVQGAELGLPIDVVIFAGETEAHMAQMMTGEGLIGPDTKVTVSTRLKS